MKKYIDISAHQGVVDFEKVKGHVDGIMLRAGYGKNNIDKQFVRNVQECNRLGIPCGAYWFSYAYTVEMATKEAKYFLAAVEPYVMELPLAFDYEYDSVKYSEKQGVTPSVSLVKNMTTVFCNTIEDAGYWCMLYSNGEYINKYFGDLAGGRYDLWYAAWPKNVDINNPPRSCGIWQWGSSRIPGISGDIDTDEAYKDYATYLRNMGFNHLTKAAVVDETLVEDLCPQGENTMNEQHSTAPEPWYTNTMNWAKENGICDGTRPTEPATRAEVAQMLLNFKNKFMK